MAASVRHFNQIPGPKNWPIFGNLLAYKFGPYSVDKYHESLVEIHERYGNVVKENLSDRVVVHLFDPADAQKVYANEGKKPSVIPLQPTIQLYRKIRKLNTGLGNLNGDEWYRLRKGIQPAVLRPKSVRVYLPLVNQIADDFIQEIKKRRSDDYYVDHLWSLTSKWNLESAGKIFLETSLGCFDRGSNEKTVEELVENNLKVFFYSAHLKYSLPIYRYFPTTKWRALVAAEDRFMKQISSYINKAVDKMKDLYAHEKLGEKYHFLYYLYSLPYLNADDLFILTLSMMSDGLTTTSPAAVCMLYCLSKNPEVQEKLYQEIKKQIPPNSPVTDEILENMSYLKAFMKECFRIYPTGTEVSRILPKDIEVGNYQIPAGTPVDLNHMVLFKSEKLFPEPEKFRPERWLNLDQSSIHPYLMTPFSFGVRTCAGRRFAEQDLQVLLIRIVQNFKLNYNPSDSPLQQVYATLLFPDKVPRIAFNDRKIEN